jgi:hypothetical protein
MRTEPLVSDMVLGKKGRVMRLMNWEWMSSWRVSAFPLFRGHGDEERNDVPSIDVKFFTMRELSIVEINQGSVFAFRDKYSDQER